MNESRQVVKQGTAGELSDAGGLRDRNVVIGARGKGFDEARFVPSPHGDQLRAGVEGMLSWINEPPNLPTVVQAAIAHYQFETLHPYSDGNGRLGRLLVVVQLLRGAVIREPLLVVSPWFEQRRGQYQDALLSLSMDGDWDTWIAFFAEGVVASATASQVKVERLLDLQENFRTRVQAAGKRGLADRLAADLVGRPYITASEVSSDYAVSRQGAHKAIKALTELRILEEAGVRASSNAALFAASEVVEVVSS
jgi:Fic family protein